MKLKISILLILFCIWAFGTNIIKKNNHNELIWNDLDIGIQYSEIQAKKITNIGEYKVSFLKINPRNYKFHLVSATENDSLQRTAKEWCNLKKLILAVNAGMYGGKSKLLNVGYMSNYEHINNSVLKENYKAVIAFNPKNNNETPLKIIDLENENWQIFKEKYNSFTQCMRLIDSKSNAVYWKQKYFMRSSIVALATDYENNVLIIFTRSPFTPNEFNHFLLQLPLKIKTAVYLEGGPEASLYFNNGTIEFEKIGSYVSRTYAHNRNNQFRKLPNIIGISKINNSVE